MASFIHNEPSAGEAPPSLSFAFEHYAASLLPDEACADLPFLSYYSFPSTDKRINEQVFSRRQFCTLVQRAVRLMQQHKVQKGDRVLMHLSANRVEDLVIRTAAVVLGFVPVTVNWQADSIEQVAYKLRATSARAVVFDYQSQGVADLRRVEPEIHFIHISEVLNYPPIEDFKRFLEKCEDLPTMSDTRCIIFTSGTTGNPKGVELSYANYTTNQATFESFLALEDTSIEFCPVVVNPMHHTNSTSITDWALRRPNTRLHLLEKYTGQYWAIAVAATAGVDLMDVNAWDHTNAPTLPKRTVLPLVSRHIDFLENLVDGDKLQSVSSAQLATALNLCVLLLGSAPVGPTTINRLKKYSIGNLPTVRFGSTETTLQVTGIPLSFRRDAVMALFERGWKHVFLDEECVGYYIGQDHQPFTTVKVVKSIKAGDANFLMNCDEGEPGYIVTKGGHVMKGYVNVPTTSAIISDDGWYLNLGDIGFFFTNPSNGRPDFYWQSRDSQMLIRGGANYSYEQVNSELTSFIAKFYNLPSNSFKLAVCGLRIRSEHEDDCCVMLEPTSSEIQAGLHHMQESFVEEANSFVSKGAKPTYFRIGVIPMVQSKGIVSIPELTKDWKTFFGNTAK